jgi:hypothetical protein
MALITPDELIVFLDFPADTQPTDRAQLVCNLVIDAVTRVAGSTLTDPAPAGVKGIALVAAGRLYDNPTALRSESLDDVTQTYAGDVQAVLTVAEREELRRIYGTGGTAPLYSFPDWDWSWKAVPPSPWPTWTTT